MGQDDVEVTIYTPEETPLGVFGAEASDGLRADLEAAGVQVRTGVVVAEDPVAPARLIAQPGDEHLNSQRIVTLARVVARGVGGLSVDNRGFIRTDEHGRVGGAQNVWAAGDAIAYPIKQGGLAAQEADAAAESIAAAAGAGVAPQPFWPVLRGVLLAGRGRQWISRELSKDADGEAQRHALWWPPTKIAGRYLAPYLASLEETEYTDEDRPAGQLVEFTPEGHWP
jgi:sulfide:quinone oxidoreductase